MKRIDALTHDATRFAITDSHHDIEQLQSWRAVLAGWDDDLAHEAETSAKTAHLSLWTCESTYRDAIILCDALEQRIARANKTIHKSTTVNERKPVLPKPIAPALTPRWAPVSDAKTSAAEESDEELLLPLRASAIASPNPPSASQSHRIWMAYGKYYSSMGNHAADKYAGAHWDPSSFSDASATVRYHLKKHFPDQKISLEAVTQQALQHYAHNRHLLRWRNGMEIHKVYDASFTYFGLYLPRPGQTPLIISFGPV